MAPALAGASFPGRNGKIAYVCRQGQFTVNHFPQEICTVKPGSRPVRLTRNALPDLNPDFSADGQTIAFEEIHQAANCHSPLCANGEIYTIRANGTGLRRITRTPSVSESDPSLSPSGKTIAYTKDLFMGDPKIGLVRVSDGKTLGTLGGGVDPSWSPSGKKLAFARGDHFWSVGTDAIGDYSIYTMNANGSSKTRLTSINTYANGVGCPAAPEGVPRPTASRTGPPTAHRSPGPSTTARPGTATSTGWVPGGVEIVPDPVRLGGARLPAEPLRLTGREEARLLRRRLLQSTRGRAAEHLGSPDLGRRPPAGRRRLPARLGPTALGAQRRHAPAQIATTLKSRVLLPRL